MATHTGQEETDERQKKLGPLGSRQLALLVQGRLQLLQQAEVLGQAWLDAVRRTRESEIELAQLLEGCDNPTQIMELLAQSTKTRIARSLVEGQRLNGLFLNLYGNGLKLAWLATATNLASIGEVSNPSAKSPP